MTDQHRIIDPEQLDDNTFRLIGKDWMLITAGTPEFYNTMTGSWGGFGVLWDKKICFCVVRPTRYTYGFMEKSDFFTLSFFTEEYRKALLLCGTKSGRAVNKTKETGLTPVKGNVTVYFDEARLVLECKKLYFQDLDPDHFLDPGIEKFYPQKDYHRMYVGEVMRCLIK